MNFTGSIVKLFQIDSKLVAVRVHTNEREMVFSKNKPPLKTYDWMEVKHWAKLNEMIIAILSHSFALKERNFALDNNVKATLRRWNCPLNIKNSMGPSSEQRIDLAYDCSVVYDGPTQQMVCYDPTSNNVDVPKLPKRLSKHFTLAKVKSINTANSTPDEISRQLEEMNPQPQPIKRNVITLKNLTAEMILATFDTYKSIFDDIYTIIMEGTRISELGRLHERFVLDLVTDEVRMQMAEKIRTTYNSTKRENKLFVIIMLPQWLLQLTMRKYKLSRDDTISNLLAQAIEEQRERSAMQQHQ